MAKKQPLAHRILAWIAPERTIYIRTGDTLHHRTLSPQVQIVTFLAVSGALVALVFLFALFVLNTVGGPIRGVQTEVMQAAYEQRIAALTEERNRLRTDLEDLALRKGQAATAAQQQSASALALTTQNAQLEADLQRVTAERDLLAADLAEALALAEALGAERDNLTLQLASALRNGEDLERAVALLANRAATEAQDARDLTTAYATLEEEVQSFATEQALIRQHQERVYTRLETAVEAGIETLDGVFKRAGTDVEALIENMRETYTGRGGPEVPLPQGFNASGIPEDMPVGDFWEPEVEPLDQAELLYLELQRLEMMRVAFEAIPFAHPVQNRHRTTSRFGPRRDPFTGELRQHNGIDFAARTGTPIYAAAGGTVVLAGTLGAYGKMVKIRHDFGYETVYAHLNRVRVQRGDRLERGDRVGDLGSTGRSTGPHLHYEIRKGGRAIDPITYLRAARDVL